MTPSELKAAVEATGRESHFFTRRSMRFFGDTMRNYGVRASVVRDAINVERKVWELYRRRRTPKGATDSSYFDRSTFVRVFEVHNGN